jgi:hypothetical protein
MKWPVSMLGAVGNKGIADNSVTETHMKRVASTNEMSG